MKGHFKTYSTSIFIMVYVFSFIILPDSIFAQNYFDQTPKAIKVISNLTSIDTVNTYLSNNRSSHIFLSSLDINDDDINGLLIRASEKLNDGYIAEATLDLNKVIKLDSTISMAFALKGYCQFFSGKIDSALTLIEHSLVLDERNSLAYFSRGRICILKNKPKDAIKDLLIALEIDESLTEAYYYLAILYARENKYEKAIKNLEKAIELAPYFQEAYIEIAKINIQRERKNEAFKVLQEAHNKIPNNTNLYLFEAILYLFNSEVEKALVPLNEALKIQPTNFFALLIRGEINTYYKRYDHAFNDFILAYTGNCYIGNALIKEETQEKLIKQTGLYKKHFLIDSLQISQYWLNYQSALCQYLFQDFNNAIFNLNAIISDNPDIAELYEIRGTIFLFKQYQRSDERDFTNYLELAERDFEIALQKNNTSYFSLVNLASLHYRLNNFDSVSKYLVRALRLQPDDPELMYIMAECYYSQENYLAAMINYDIYLKSHPKDIQVLLKNANLKRDLEYFNEALINYLTLIELDPHNPIYYITVAEILVYQKKYDEARGKLKNLIDRNPDLPEAYYAMGNFNFFNNDYQEALKFYYIAENMQLYDPNLKKLIASSHLQLGDTTKSISILKSEIKDSKNYYGSKKVIAENYYLLVNCYSDTKNKIKQLSKAIKYNDCALYHCKRALIHKNNANYSQSIKDFKYAVSFEPDNYEIVLNLARVYRLNKEFELATSNYSKAYQLKTDTNRAQRELAIMNYELGNFNKCKQHLKVALDADSTDYVSLIIKLLCDNKISNTTSIKDTLGKTLNDFCKQNEITKKEIIKEFSEVLFDNKLLQEVIKIVNNSNCEDEDSSIQSFQKYSTNNG